ncbi:MAG: pantoate--beta-alanine ligase [Deltaproteobacteria bacterium]|nr:MAG: pantoate--beta-alanine ligase [Deltaproteobacteria bacterium]
MKTITDIAKMQEFSMQLHVGGLRVGFVPTMGYLHEGHLELIRAARRDCDVVIVSIFVNPTQFNRRDDFDSYPRDEERDRRLLEAERVDVLFLPRAEDVYPAGAATSVHVSGLTETLCGPGRPGHFDGVTTVVAALFNMVRPDVAYFGEKDYQQLQVVRRMTEDLHFPIRIVGVPTVREADGLAMSSRNARLDAGQRQAAVVLSRALQAAADAFAGGERESRRLIDIARARIETEPQVRVEYLEVVGGADVQPVETAGADSVMAVAAWLGDVRLIDNVILGRGIVVSGNRSEGRGRPAAAGGGPTKTLGGRAAGSAAPEPTGDEIIEPPGVGSLQTGLDAKQGGGDGTP